MAREPIFKRRIAKPVELPKAKRKPEPAVTPTLKTLLKNKQTKEKNTVKPILTTPIAKPVINKPDTKSKPIKYYKSKDGKNIILLLKEEGKFQIEVYTLDKSGNKVGRPSTYYLYHIKNLKDAEEEFNNTVKPYKDAKPLVMTREETDKYLMKKRGPKIMSKDMATQDKLNVFASLIENKLNVLAKPKLVKKKRTSKQVTRKLMSIGKQLLKKEARIKEKKEALDKEHQRIKALKVKHHQRLGTHLNKVKERELKKKGVINPPDKVPKFDKNDLSKAVVKKK